jgi:ankyrin repeat protein
MHFAAKNGSEAVIKILMERDPNLLDSPNKNLDTPLMMAVLARNHIAARCVHV